MPELLDLSTIVERDTIRITSKKHPGGKVYEYVNQDELGPLEHETIVNRHSKITGLLQILQTKKKLTPVQQRELRKSFVDIAKILLPAIEPAVLSEMTEAHLGQIVSAWAAKNGAAEGEASAPRRTGAASSRVSKRSTAATRRRGSTRRSSS